MEGRLIKSAMDTVRRTIFYQRHLVGKGIEQGGHLLALQSHILERSDVLSLISGVRSSTFSTFLNIYFGSGTVGSFL